jgi:hypothetical protein
VATESIEKDKSVGRPPVNGTNLKKIPQEVITSD